jgi:hypothetical protein
MRLVPLICSLSMHLGSQLKWPQRIAGRWGRFFVIFAFFVINFGAEKLLLPQSLWIRRRIDGLQLRLDGLVRSGTLNS